MDSFPNISSISNSQDNNKLKLPQINSPKASIDDNLSSRSPDLNSVREDILRLELDFLLLITFVDIYLTIY